VQGHSAHLITRNNAAAQEFMENADAAAAYQTCIAPCYRMAWTTGLGGELLSNR